MYIVKKGREHLSKQKGLIKIMARYRATTQKPEQKDTKPFYYADVTYGVWKIRGRTRNIVYYNMQAIIQANYAYILQNGHRKLVSGKHFRINEKYLKRPCFYDQKASDKILNEKILKKHPQRKNN